MDISFFSEKHCGVLTVAVMRELLNAHPTLRPLVLYFKVFKRCAPSVIRSALTACVYHCMCSLESPSPTRALQCIHGGAVVLCNCKFPSPRCVVLTWQPVQVLLVAHFLSCDALSRDASWDACNHMSLGQRYLGLLHYIGHILDSQNEVCTICATLQG